MEKTCVVDFDKTLLKVDSIVFLLKQEHLYLVPSIFFWGVVLWFGKHLLSRARQIGMRRRLKFNILKELTERGEKEILQTYTPLLASYIDDALVQKVQKEYSRVIVISSSWQPLIESILRYKHVNPFFVHGTVATNTLSDFVPCWYTNKLPVLEQHQIQQFDLITDSRDDEPLARRADHVEWIRQKTEWTLTGKLLLAILILAALVRLCGVKFGLPFWVVGDEPSVIFAALKMLQLKTVIPSLHVSEFIGNFYYGPYLSYLYLVPFTVVTGIFALFFPGNITQLTSYLTVDPSLYFIIARLISIGIGTATVLLVYVWVKQMTRREQPALWSAFFLATSLMHVNFSIWAKHWVVAGFLLALVGCVLSSRMARDRRYLISAVLIGLGMGVSVQAGIVGVYVVLWALCVDTLSPLRVWKEMWAWKTIGVGALLVALAYLLWPYGFGFLQAVGGGTRALTFSGFVYHVQLHVTNLLLTEPLLFVLGVIGVNAGFRSYRRQSNVLFLFIVAYVVILYATIGSNGRFIMMLYPVLTVYAGIGISCIFELRAGRSTLIARVCAGFVVVTLFVVIFRFDYLLLKNDTRVQVRTWLAKQITPETSLVVAVPLMRLETVPEEIEEQRRIDSSSLRTFEEALLRLPDNIPRRRFQALNLYSAKSPEWFKTFSSYLDAGPFEYVVYNKEFLQSKGAQDAIPGTMVHVIHGIDEQVSKQDRLPDGFGGGLKDIFMTDNLGPTILIHALK